VTAISEYDRLKPDIVLMDITMPQRKALRRPKKIVQKNPEARVVMVSSVDIRKHRSGVAAGRHGILCRAVKPEVL